MLDAMREQFQRAVKRLRDARGRFVRASAPSAPVVATRVWPAVVRCVPCETSYVRYGPGACPRCNRPL